MRRFMGPGLGLLAGGIGMIIGLLMLLAGAAFEMEVGTLFLGYMAAGTLAVIAIITSLLIFVGALIGTRKPGTSALLLIGGGVLGFLIGGAVLAIPMIPALVSAVAVLGASKREISQ